MGQVGPEGPNPQQLGGSPRAIRNSAGPTCGDCVAARGGGRGPGPQGGCRRGGQTAEAAAVAQEGGCGRGHRRKGAKIEESVRTGQQTPEQAAEERAKAFGPNPAEIKARSDQEGAHIEAQSFVNSIAEAQDLVNTGVYNGKGAGS